MKILIALITVLIISLVSAVYSDLPIGSKAPDFSLTTITSERFSLSDTLNKPTEVVVVNVWATWCPHCVDEIPYMIDLDKKYNNKSVKFVGVSIDSDKSKVISFAKDNKIKYTIALDPDGNKLGESYKISGVPATFVIDKKGKIRYCTSGFSNIKENQIAEVKKIEDVIKNILKESSKT